MEELTLAPGLTTSNVGESSIDPTTTLDGHRDQSGTTPVEVMDDASPVKDKQDRVFLAFQVAAVSGFMESVQSSQTACLSLCNICRGNVPVTRLKISRGVPPSMLALVYPDLDKDETDNPSRVPPHRRVLRVHWTFDDHLALGGEAETQWQTDVAPRDVDLAVGVCFETSAIRWPQGTREIAFLGLNCAIETVTWPLGLDKLWFEQPTDALVLTPMVPGIFNTSLDRVAFPGGLREVFLGNSFNQSIDGVAWPEGLECMSLPGFNQPIGDVQWPPGLKTLEFVSRSKIMLWTNGGTDRQFQLGDSPNCFKGHGCFNQLLGTTLPTSLETLWLSEVFNKTLEGVAWPNGIVTLGFTHALDYINFDDNIDWPSSVHELFLINQPRRGFRFPQGVKVTTLRKFEEESSTHSFDTDDYRDSVYGYASDSAADYDDDSDRYVDFFDECD